MSGVRKRIYVFKGKWNGLGRFPAARLFMAFTGFEIHGRPRSAESAPSTGANRGLGH